jgi:hypothetical protein|tara:strand:- start:2672 stop:2941 length:270 start_codon:yes stop_codon:yes gene_type:complete
MKLSNTIKNTTCFSEHKSRNIDCKKENCRYWIDSKNHLNCSVLGAKKGPLTLQEIGDIFKVTRMRICQIEKTILDKIQDSLHKEDIHRS